MKIVAKSKFDQNIYDKILKGATAIELHLDQDFVDNPIAWDEQIVQDTPIVAIHVPLIEGENDVDIEIAENKDILKKTCDFAKGIAETQKHNVTVICHLGTSPEALKGLGLYKNTIEFMRELANTYEQLEFAVENVTLFDHATSSHGNHIGFRAVQFDSAVKFAKDVSHPRVGTCLDTCHAMMDIELVSLIYNHIYVQQDHLCAPKPLDMEDFFEANKATIKWIHLANSKSYGLGKCHGMPFTENDIDKLQYILWLYYKYNYSCPITLEVREEDYSNAANYATTNEILRSQLYLLD